MKLHAFDIPDDPAELPAWLEGHLVGMHLGELVAELAAVHDKPAAPQTLDKTLGPVRGELLQRGLAALSREALQTLLRQPVILLELQELVLQEGGTYWSQLAASSACAQVAHSGRQAAMPNLLGESRLKASVTNKAAPTTSRTERTGGWYQHPLVVSLTTAALLLIGFFLFNQSRKPPAAPPPWGWSRPGALAATASREQYLTGLADAADEWFKKQPADATALATRIAQFRTGCSTLILADHPPLDAADKQWLVGKCRAWAAKIDGHLTALEAGEPVTEVRAAMDDTVRKLAAAIRERAKG